MGATTVTERERKFDFDDARPVPRLAGTGPVAHQSDPRESRLDNTYYDTADLRLARAGVTLRRRVGGHDAGWHLKRPAAGGAREETQLPPGDGVPAEFAEAVRGWTGGADLVRVAHLRVDRFSYDLTGAEGQRLAVLTDDHVHGERAGSPARLDRWRELEVELDAGPPELLDTLADALVSDGVRPAHWPSKLNRILAADLVADAGRADAGEVVIGHLRDQVEAIRAHDEAVRRGDHDAIDRLRIAMRRARATLRGYRRLFVRPAARQLARELRWACRALSRVRDDEVRWETVRAELAGLPREPAVEHARRALLDHVDELAQGDRRAVRVRLASGRYARLLGALDEFVADPPLTVSASSGRCEVRRAVRRADRRLARAAEALRDDPDALPEVRRRAEVARYVADVARPLLGKRVRTWRRAVTTLHEHLDEHDALAGAGALLRARAEAGAADAYVYGRVHERLHMRRAALRKVVEAELRALPSPP